MTTRTIITAAFCAAALAGAFALFFHPRLARAQQSQKLQIASISVGPDQTLTFPTAAPTPYLEFFPDEHMTFFPPASNSSPYLLFGASTVAGGPSGTTTVLESTDLQTWKFATDQGYNTIVMITPVPNGTCNPTYDSTEFDESYAGPGFVSQDPTLPAGNLVMIYEAENHCAGGVPNGAYGYNSVGFARSSDNGKTWPAPQNSLTGGPSRYPVVQSVTAPPTTQVFAGGNLAETGFIDKSLDGNYYLYVTYQNFSATSGPLSRVARAPLGKDPLKFQKWYNGSFSQPGIGGSDTAQPWTNQACAGAIGMHSISYVDDIGLYLLIFPCRTSTTGAWYYSTATSLDLQDWTPPELIANSQVPLGSATSNCPSPGIFDGWYPSFMSPGAAPAHLHLTGTAFFTDCESGIDRTFKSRTFTITTQPQPAPVLTSGSLANGATYLPGGLVPGSWAQVQGTGLSNVTRIWTGFDFLNLGNNLPTGLSGVQVMVNNTPAPVYYVSPTQIDFQVPTGVTGTASVQVIVNGSASNTITASAAASSPGLFPNTVKGVNYPAAVYASGIYVGPSGVSGYLPASVGYHISLYATGLQSAAAGVIPTAQQISGVTVTLGNVTIPADYAGQTPYVGEFQINFTVPQSFASMPAGNYPISISLNGVSSPTMIGNPPAPIVLPYVPPSN